MLHIIMYQSLVLLVACCISTASATTPSLGDDVGSFVFADSVPMPGCDARYSASCSALSVGRTVFRTMTELNDSTDVSATLARVTAGDFNEARTFGFYPWVFTVSGNDLTLVAHGGQDADKEILSYPTVGQTLVEHLDANLIIDLDQYQEHIIAEANGDRWFRFLWEFQGVAKMHVGYARFARGGTHLVMSSYIDQQIPERENCWVDYSTFCTVHNVRAILGQAITKGLSAPTEEEFIMGASEYTYEPNDKAYVGIWKRPNINDTPFMFGHPLARRFTPVEFHDEITGGYLTDDLGISHLFDADAMVREFFKGGSIGGSWVDYPFRTKVTDPVFTKVARAVVLRQFNIDYAYFIGFTHRPLPPLLGANCETCNQNYALPCSIMNVQNLLGFAFVEALRFSTDEAGYFDSITQSGNFTEPGRFVFVARLDSSIVAHSSNPSLVGKIFNDVAIAGGFDHPDLQFSDLLEATKGAETWYGLPGDKGLLMLTQLTKDGSPLIMGSFASRRAAPTDPKCTAKYAGYCAEETVLSLVGYAMSSILATDVNSNAAIYTRERLWDAPERTIGSNFELLVIDSDYNVLFHTNSDDNGEEHDGSTSLLNLLRTKRGVVSLGSNFEANLRTASNTVGGDWVTGNWLLLDQSVISVNVFAITVEIPSRSFADVGQLVTVLSFYQNEPEPPRCGNCEKHNSFCVKEGDIAGYCDCGFWFAPEWDANITQGVDHSSCASRTSQPEMMCVATSDLQAMQTIRAVANTLFGICAAFGGVTLVWIIAKRKHPIVVLSQFPFMVLFAVSTILMASTILFIVIADDQGGPPGVTGTNIIANYACMMQVWLFGMSFTLCFTTLFIKMWRVNVIFLDTMKLMAHRQRKSISTQRLAQIITAIMSVEAVILLAWTIHDPLKFIQLDPAKPGSCRSDHAMIYLTLLGCYKFVLLVCGTVVSYRATRINSVLSEGKFVTVAMICTLQILALAAPILVLVSDDPITSMYTTSGVVFLITLTLQAVIFGPKLTYFYTGIPANNESVGNEIVQQQQAKSNSSGSRYKTGATEIHGSTL